MTEAILDRAEAVVAGTTPMGRIGQSGELVLTELFLASEECQLYYSAGDTD